MFPASAFQTLGEIEAYVGGDLIVCLVCGKSLKALNSHVQRSHELSDEEYRKRFNIPKKYALVSARTALLHSRVALRPENMERMSKVGTEYGPTTRGHGIAHDLLLSRPKEWDFRWHLHEAESNPLYLTVEPPAGQASWHTFWKARFADPELQQKWERARLRWDHQSHYQPRGEHGTFCPVDGLALGAQKSA